MLKFFYSSILPAFILLAFTACTNNGRKEITTEEIMNIHRGMLTIDSHADTPLRMMRPGTDLGRKSDPRERGGKVDFVRMNEGGLDGIFFAVFVSQSDRDQQGNERARQEALRLFDSIHAVTDRYPGMVELALQSDDLERITADGQSVIYLAPSA